MEAFRWYAERSPTAAEKRWYAGLGTRVERARLKATPTGTRYQRKIPKHWVVNGPLCKCSTAGGAEELSHSVFALRR